MHLHARGLYDMKDFVSSKVLVRSGEAVGSVDPHEFYAILRGMDMRDMPDIPIRCRPLLDTSTHQLAIETDPRWCLKIRHVGCWRSKTRPKISLYTEDRCKSPVISFALPAQTKFETLDAAFKALEGVDFALSPHNISLTAIQRRHEAELREKIRAEIRNERRPIPWQDHWPETPDTFELLTKYNDGLETELRSRRRPKLTVATNEDDAQVA